MLIRSFQNINSGNLGNFRDVLQEKISNLFNFNNSEEFINGS